MPQRWSDSADSEAADIAACRALLRGGSRTFFAASLLLPRRVRDPASALYAFCRLADDAIDVAPGREGALARLRERLARAYDGRPLPIAADRALAAVVARHAIPIALPEAMLEGFAWNAEGRRYETFAELQDYAARVAGAVGAMMAVLMGARSTAAVARACDLGVAMQLSNIARDVGEDARAGRLYLPLAWMREAGVNPDAWLAAPVYDAALASVIARLLDAARNLYARAASGIAELPASCRPGIRAAGLLYAEIGREVARAGYDSVSTRAIVPGTRKAWLLAKTLVPGEGETQTISAPPLKAVQFLVDAVAIAPRPIAVKAQTRKYADRVAWTIELFQQLDQRSGA